MLKELQALGLSEKEAKIYAASVELGTATPADIAGKSGLKRPTVYLHLDEMAGRGLVEKVLVSKKDLYKPRDPSLFERQLLEGQNALAKIKASYEAGQVHTGKPHVQVFEGLENVRRIYDELGAENSARFWSNVAGYQAHFHKEWVALCERYQKNGTTVREIIADNKESRRWSRYLRGIIGPTYAARVATVEGLHNDGAVTTQALYIFRLHEFNFYVVKIEDATIAATYRALFDMAWKSAKAF